MTERVSPKSIITGDVISFQSYLGLPEGQKPDTNIGIVIDIHEKDSEIAGFDVFPLTEYELGNFVPNDEKHYMIGRRETTNIDYMGLDIEKNYRLSYKGHVVPNRGQYLNEDGKGGITRHGSLSTTPLLGDIIKKAMRSNNNFGAFLGSSAEVARLKGNAAFNPLQHIQETRSVEKGKNLLAEQLRQDIENGDARIIQTKAKNITTQKKIIKRRANTPHADGTIRDISLTDATALSLIPQNVADFFSQAHDARRKPLETLRQVFSLSDQNPDLIQRWQEKADQDGDMNAAVKDGWYNFMRDVTSNDPSAHEKYEGVETHYSENYENA
ncbi:MAG: hypothetical protein ACRBDL_00880 [Alphaproteobacteria bacterium]